LFIFSGRSGPVSPGKSGELTEITRQHVAAPASASVRAIDIARREPAQLPSFFFALDQNRSARLVVSTRAATTRRCRTTN